MSEHHPLTCELCRNRGLVTIYHPEDVQHANATGNALLPSGYPRRQFCAVPCKCSLGDKHTVRHKQGKHIDVQRYGTSYWHVLPVMRYGQDEPLLWDIVRDVDEQLADKATANVFNQALEDE